MKNYNPLYYLLFVLLIMGSFASMAQNAYGIKILGLVTFAFALLFFIQLIIDLRLKAYRKFEVIESLSLVVLSVVLAFRVFYIRFPFIEILFGVAGLILIIVYLKKLLQSWENISKLSKVLASIILLFHSSIIVYIVSMVTVPFFPRLAEPLGGLGFALLIIFFALSLVKKEIMLEGERISGLDYVTKFKDRSVVLLTLFFLFTAYMGLTKIGVLPKMYSDEYPQAYFDLVSRAESGQEKPVNGIYQHEEFKEMYDRFISRHSNEINN